METNPKSLQKQHGYKILKQNNIITINVNQGTNNTKLYSQKH